MACTSGAGCTVNWTVRVYRAGTGRAHCATQGITGKGAGRCIRNPIDRSIDILPGALAPLALSCHW